MSDYYYGKIQIWGNLKEKDLQTFLLAVIRDNPESGFEDFGEYIRSHSGDTLEFENVEASHGYFEDIESTCISLGLNFTRYSGGYYDCAPCSSWYVDGKEGYEALDNEDNTYMTLSGIIKYGKAAREFKEEDAPKLLNTGGVWEKYLAKQYLETGKIPTIEEYAQHLQDANPEPGVFNIIQ